MFSSLSARFETYTIYIFIAEGIMFQARRIFSLCSAPRIVRFYGAFDCNGACQGQLSTTEGYRSLKKLRFAKAEPFIVSRERSNFIIIHGIFHYLSYLLSSIRFR